MLTSIPATLRGIGAEAYRFGSILPVSYATKALGRELSAAERAEILAGWRKERDGGVLAVDYSTLESLARKSPAVVRVTRTVQGCQYTLTVAASDVRPGDEVSL